MMTIQRLGLGAVLLGVTSITGCYAQVRPEPVVYTTAAPAPAPVADSYSSDGYEPAYYDGYMVYYDDGGRPYYYDNGGAVVWVAASSPYYIGLTNHWHVYGAHYHTWYAHTGYRAHGYRSNPGHYQYHGYVHGEAHAEAHGGRGHR